MRTKRLRIFAGPNGSGKSALYKYLISQEFFRQYYYINADDISKALTTGYEIIKCPFTITEEDFYLLLEKSTFAPLMNISDVKKYLSIKQGYVLYIHYLNYTQQ